MVNNIFFLIIIIIILISIIIYWMTKKSELFGNTIKPNKTYYFDNNATTYIYEQDVLNEIDRWINCGNPSNTLHSEGQKAKSKLQESRDIVAKDLNVSPDEVYFTSGATESNEIVIKRIISYYLLANKKCSIITSNIEHPSVLNIFKYYDKNNPNINVVIVPVETDINNPYYGTVNPVTLEDAILNADNIALMSLMYANNETGLIQDVATFGKLAKKHNIFFHCDATQAIGKFIIHPNKLNIHALSFSGHKFHVPKGVGGLFIKHQCPTLDTDSQKVCAQFGTNSQEFGVRGGTENIPYIAALALGLKKVHERRESKNKNLKDLKKYIVNNLESNGCIIIKPKKVIGNTEILNPSHGILDNTILVILKGINTCNKMFATELSKKYNICIGVSSACQSGKESHVLTALNISDMNKDKIIRISLSDYTTFEDVNYLIKSINKLLDTYRTTPIYNSVNNQI